MTEKRSIIYNLWMKQKIKNQKSNTPYWCMRSNKLKDRRKTTQTLMLLPINHMNERLNMYRLGETLTRATMDWSIFRFSILNIVKLDGLYAITTLTYIDLWYTFMLGSIIPLVASISASSFQLLWNWESISIWWYK